MPRLKIKQVEGLSNLELELAQLLATLDCFTELSYTGDKLTLIEIFTDSGMLTKLFEKTFTYTGDNLTTMTITRMSDGATITCSYSYSGSTLISVDKVQS